MKKIIKSYYPCLISITFMYVYVTYIKMAFYEIQPSMLISIITLLLVIGIFAEMIGFIIHASKNKELKNIGLWCVLIYMFNLFIVPYYNLKYVMKTDKLVLKVTIYVLLMVCVLIFGLKGVSFPKNELYLKSLDNKIEIKLEGHYFEKKGMGQYDLYASDNFRGINIGVFLYDSEYEITLEEAQQNLEDYVKNNKGTTELLDSYKKVLLDRNIISNTFTGYSEGDKFIYQVSTIDFKDKNYKVSLIQVCFYEDYNEIKDEFNDIINNIKYIEE